MGGEVHDVGCLIRLVSYVDQFLDWFGLFPCWNLDLLICMNNAHRECTIINVLYGAMHVGYMLVFGFSHLGSCSLLHIQDNAIGPHINLLCTIHPIQVILIDSYVTIERVMLL